MGQREKADSAVSSSYHTQKKGENSGDSKPLRGKECRRRDLCTF